jgi:hypothetical protein
MNVKMLLRNVGKVDDSGEINEVRKENVGGH